MSYLAQDVANFLLDHTEERGIFPTNLWLNKVLFFLHSTYLIEQGTPLLKNRFTAWKYGPVIRPIYDEFKSFGSDPIRGKRANRFNPESGTFEYIEPRLEHSDIEFIKTNLDPFLGRPAAYLVEKSHEPGSPWDDIWEEAKKRAVPGMWISNELIIQKAKARLS